ncbi:MAG: glucose 1-dehydrogenase [Pirellulales bacterium]
MDLKGQAALITGGGTGVGRATALELARRGCHVAVNYSRSREEAERTAAEVAAMGVGACAIQADVASDADCRRMVDAAVSTLGKLDILVNNAGTTRFISLDDLDEVKDDDWRRIFDVNVKGAFQCCRAARDALRASGRGHIINVSSIAALRGKGSSIPYCASKAALNNLTIALAGVLAPEIRVNAVAPGFISGRWLEQGLGERYEAAKTEVESRLPLGRINHPEDIAAAILSLLTGAETITGQILVCDSGMLLTA